GIASRCPQPHPRSPSPCVVPPTSMPGSAPISPDSTPSARMLRHDSHSGGPKIPISTSPQPAHTIRGLAIFPASLRAVGGGRNRGRVHFTNVTQIHGQREIRVVLELAAIAAASFEAGAVRAMQPAEVNRHRYTLPGLSPSSHPILHAGSR